MEKSSSTILHLVLLTSTVVQNRKSWCPAQLQFAKNDLPFFCLHLRSITASLVWYWLHIQFLWQYPFVSCACRGLPTPDIPLNAYPKIQVCLPPDPSDGSFASLPSVSIRIQYQDSFRRSVVLTPSPTTFLHYRDILISQCRSLVHSFSCVTYDGGSKMKYNLLMPYFKRAVCNPNK